MKNFLTYSMIFAFSLSSLNCTKEEVCGTLAKADMAFKLMSLINPSISTGIAFVVNSIVQNAASEECETVSSGEHTNGYVSVYRNNPNDAWEQIDFIDANGNSTNMANARTPSIAGGSNQPINLELSMSVPGKYMIIGSSDSRNDVDERNENNNGAETEEGSLNGVWNEESSQDRARKLRANYLDGLVEGKDYIIIDVKSSPNYDATEIPEGLPKIIVHNISFE